MKPIKKGDEIVIDYAMVGIDDFTMSCTCGSRYCRKTILPFSKLDNTLKEKYRDYILECLKSRHMLYLWTVRHRVTTTPPYSSSVLLFLIPLLIYAPTLNFDFFLMIFRQLSTIRTSRRGGISQILRSCRLKHFWRGNIQTVRIIWMGIQDQEYSHPCRMYSADILYSQTVYRT